jgi:hypothetical protein
MKRKKNGIMYSATKEGMKHGYWKIINFETGETVRSGISSAAIADKIAESLNNEPPHISGYDRGGRLPVADDFRKQ